MFSVVQRFCVVFTSLRIVLWITTSPPLSFASRAPFMQSLIVAALMCLSYKAVLLQKYDLSVHFDVVVFQIDCLACVQNSPWCTNFTSLAIVFCVMCTIFLVQSNLAHPICVCQSMSSGFYQNTSFALLWVLLQIDISLFCFVCSLVIYGGWWCSMVVL